MKHLNPDERLDLIEAEAPPAHPHLDSCVRCRAEITEAREVLRSARSVDVPEPSPLFWDSLSRRVSEATAAAGPEPARRWWPFWRVLIPLTAGVGALLIAVGVGHGVRSALLVPEPATASSEQAHALSPVETGDEQWLLLVNLAADFDLETIRDSLGMPAAGRVNGAMWQLNEQERAELAVLLRAELQRQP